MIGNSLKSQAAHSPRSDAAGNPSASAERPAVPGLAAENYAFWRIHGLPYHRAGPVLEPTQPTMLVVVDTEEEFDWAKPFDREARGVTHIRMLPDLQTIFEKLAITPTYLIDYPIADNPESAETFRTLVASGQAEIGAQLHPWVNPPFNEPVSTYNSYACNLPFELERAKIYALLDVIQRNVGIKPEVYKAGRYGVSHDTLAILEEVGIPIDASTMPAFDLSTGGGPDFLGYPNAPYRFRESGIYEIPTTAGYVGRLRLNGDRWWRRLHMPVAHDLKLAGVFARLGLLERMRLSPEGCTTSDLLRLTRALQSDGQRLFTFTFHSPSIKPGCTPYVRTEADRKRLLRTIADYLAWFRDEVGGRFITYRALRAELDQNAPQR